MQHMICAVIFPRALECHYILRLCHNAYHAVVALGIGADSANIHIRQPLTDAAEMYFAPRINKRLGKFFGALGRLL